MAWKPDLATTTVFSSLIIYGAIGIILYLIFEKFRGQKAIYSPRMLSNKLKCPNLSLNGFLGWIPAVLSVSDEETFDIVGTDGFIMLRFLRLLMKSSAFAGLLGLAVLLPVYGTAEPTLVPGIQKMSMANVSIGGLQLWASTGMAYIFTLYFLHLLNEEYREFVVIRQAFFRDPGAQLPIQANLSCLIENLPEPLQKDGALKTFLDQLFPGEVYAANVVQNMKTADKTIKDRAVLIDKLEKSIALYESLEDKSLPPMVGLKKDGTPVKLYGGEKVPAISYYKKEIQKQNKMVKILLAEAEAYQLGTYKIAKPGPSAMSKTVTYLSGKGKAGNKKKVEKVSTTDKDSQIPTGVVVESYDGDIENHKNGGTSVVEANKREKVESEYQESAVDEDAVEEDADDDDEVVNKDRPILSTNGFATFTTIRAKSTFCQMPVLSHYYPEIKGSPASSPSDYIWSNITFSRASGEKGTKIVRVLLTVGLLFWGFIIAFIGAISNLTNLTKYIPIIELLDPVSYALLAGLLPVVVLAVFFSLLPVVFTALAIHVEGKKTYGDVQDMVCNWSFAYNIANVYLLLLSGSLFNSLSDAIADPFSIATLLGEAIPSVSVFFINFFIAQTLLGLPMMLVRIGPWVTNLLYTRILGEKKLTIRGILTGPMAHVNNDYGSDIPPILYVTVVSLLYWVIAPIVTAISAIYFTGLYVSYKYQFLYVFAPKFQSGGRFFYILYGYTMVALLCSAYAILAFMAIKQSVGQTIVLIPLPIMVIIAWRSTEAKFKVFSENMALTLIVERDEGLKAPMIGNAHNHTHNNSNRINATEHDSNDDIEEESNIKDKNFNRSIPGNNNNTTNLDGTTSNNSNNSDATIGTRTPTTNTLGTDTTPVASTQNAVTHFFKMNFYKQPAITETNAKILPYRIENTPIFDAKTKQLNPVYYDAIDFLGTDMEMDENTNSNDEENNSLINTNNDAKDTTRQLNDDHIVDNTDNNAVTGNNNHPHSHHYHAMKINDIAMSVSAVNSSRVGYDNNNNYNVDGGRNNNNHNNNIASDKSSTKSPINTIATGGQQQQGNTVNGPTSNVQVDESKV